MKIKILTQGGDTMPNNTIIKSTFAIILLFLLFKVCPFLTTSSVADLTTRYLNVNPIVATIHASNLTSKSLSTNALSIIEAKKYNLDITGMSDTTASFQKMVDSFKLGSQIKLPKGKYKLSSTVKLKDGIKLIASNDVTIIGTGNNDLFEVGNSNSFEGIEFQNCSTALRVFHKNGLVLTNCKFTNNISFAAINFYGANSCLVQNSYFYDIRKYGILIDSDSSSITIDKNIMDNAKVFGGYKNAQISGHVYCLNGSNIKVTSNTIKNSGGQGIIFGYNSSTKKGTTSSVASNNLCVGNGQEGITSYGGSKKVTYGNSIIGNTCENNRNNQIEVWQSDNNIVQYNTVDESIADRGNMGAICLFATTSTSCTENKVLSARNNGIDILAGSLNCNISNNYVLNTNKKNNVKTPESGNAILLDSNGLTQPSHITITNNTIASSSTVIYKSGIYSTSASNQHNTISSNNITGYQTGVHYYAQKTCGK